MKKLNYLLSLLVVVGMAFSFTSCEEDGDPVPPTLTFAGGDYTDADATVEPGATVMFSWTAQSGDAKLDKFTIKLGNAWVVDSDNYEWNGEEDPANWDNDTYVGSASFAAGADGDEHVFTFTVTDKDGETAEKVITITVEGSGNPISTYTAKLMGAQSNATYGSFLDAETGTVYLLADARANASAVDVFYYFGSSNEASFAALDDTDANEFSIISDAAWTTRNSTKFVTTSVTAADFTAMTDDSGFTFDASASSVTQLAAGDVVGFVTVDGKKGLIHVDEIVTGGDGSITIDIKIQE